MPRPQLTTPEAPSAHPEQCTVGETARLAKCTVRAVRFYEQQGLLSCVERTGGHHRRYSRTEVERLRTIIALRRAGMSLTSIRQLFLVRTSHTNGAEAAQQLSVALERQIASLSARLEHIDAIKRDLEDLYRTLQACKDCRASNFPSACTECQVVAGSDGTTTRPLWSHSNES